jgi:nicotinate-nucleotide adenylyltransferase
MLRAGLAAAGCGAGVRVHPFEFSRGRTTYTWETVAYFRDKHPDAEIFFLMGSDCLATFRRWRHFRRILASARLLVGARRGSPLSYPPGLPYVRLAGSFPPDASVMLRPALFSGAAAPGLTPGVRDYIRKRGLYFGALRRRIAGLMTPSRFRHSCRTAAMAAELAALHGADPAKAALAGLLHDAARDLSPRAQKALACLRGSGMPCRSEALARAPVTAHPYAGAMLAAKRFGVSDREVLSAIRSHAMGRPAPGLMDRIIYVADLAEEGRDFAGARRVRALARMDLDAAFAAAQFEKLSHAFRCGGWIHPESVKTWNRTLENIS